DNSIVPDRETGYSQPVNRRLHLSAEKKIKWPTAYKTIKPTVKRIDLSRLPDKSPDSLGFIPALKKPKVETFDINKLPDTILNYESLPTKPLRFITSLLAAPKLQRISRAYVKNNSLSLYEFGEPFIGNHVHEVYEDKHGFVWIASTVGL